MAEGKVSRASLLNDYASTDIATDSSLIPNVYRIPGLFGMNANEFAGVTKQDPTAEVQQVYTIGLAVPPVIAASTRYTIFIGNSGNTREGSNLNNMPYSANSPAALTGNAATDRWSLYEALAERINNNQTNYITAYNVVTLTHATDAGDNLNVGEIVTGATSGATGIIISRASVTSINVAQLPGATQFTNGENIDDETGSGPYALTTDPTLGVALRLVDDADYYPANGSRKGKNTVFLPTNSGWATPSTMLVLTTAAVYSFGQGTRMIDDVPVMERTSGNLASGTWEMATNNAPVAGATYECFRFVDYPKVEAGMPGEGSTTPQRVQVLWLEKTDASGTPIATYAATETAIMALNP